ncbi:NAD-dependent epimerase/dehydratase family protein [Seonamhaeicola maritimus]|uniref:NAD(P)-dependent oxidoreductase n=1 Tax=Seonamhaeicola maritimus TaxID=2591822 RepID=A0A5C7GHA6_9FLAO|nr:NAD(P)-dependent oxidoreductase [Seonamhaeicola maritimus]TXG37150.1 NAD(P)-dependent oxidoreductase [Seonamhaeicola maritimus]
MKGIALIFGGSGYIGTNLLKFFIKKNVFNKYIVCDIKRLTGFENEIKNGLVEYLKLDVREQINVDVQNVDGYNSWIFNFAAIHREPGHNYKEYFDTNVPGAENINEFARKTGIKNIFFTSSIAPYGKSLNQRTENSTLYPETGYGISKALAEKIHQNWLVEDVSRRLIIVRPSVIFGPHDPGNVYRMIKSLKKGTFILPDDGKVIKAYGYVYGLIESMLFTMNKKERLIVYNYAENPIVPLNEMISIVKSNLNIKKPTLKLPVVVLVFLAFIIKTTFKLIGKTSDIHPVRVRKAGFPTNIKPDYLINNNFEFKYNFENALEHWKSVSPEDFK